MRIQTMKNEFQEVEVIESNLLDPTKPTDYAEVRNYIMDGYELILKGSRVKYKPKY